MHIFLSFLCDFSNFEKENHGRRLAVQPIVSAGKVSFQITKKKYIDRY